MSVLRRATPSSRGVDAIGIEDFLDEVASLAELHSLMIARGGDLIAEGWWAPYSAERVHLLYSLSKTFTASCLGMLVDDGSVSLDRPVLSYLPYADSVAVDEKYRRLTVRHCLNMRTGHITDTTAAMQCAEGSGPQCEVLGILRDPPREEPGSVFTYNQRATYLLAAVIREVTGETLLGFARRRLLDPLGIGIARWHVTRSGKELGFSGLHTTTEAIMRLGLMVLGRGQFQGKRLLSPQWMEAATDFVPFDRPAGESDWEQGYGFQMWNARHGFRGDGAFGQFMVILPEQDMVVAATSETGDMQAILEALWTHVLPAVDRAGSRDSDTALAARLGSAAIAPLASRVEPSQQQFWRRRGGDLPPEWGDVTIEREAQGWRLRFSGLADPVLVGDGQWLESRLHRRTDEARLTLDVVSSGGWSHEGFACQIRIIESPHVVEVGRFEDGLYVAWRAVPLSGTDPFVLGASVTG